MRDGGEGGAAFCFRDGGEGDSGEAAFCFKVGGEGEAAFCTEDCVNEAGTHRDDVTGEVTAPCWEEGDCETPEHCEDRSGEAVLVWEEEPCAAAIRQESWADEATPCNGNRFGDASDSWEDWTVHLVADGPSCPAPLSQPLASWSAGQSDEPVHWMAELLRAVSRPREAATTSGIGWDRCWPTRDNSVSPLGLLTL